MSFILTGFLPFCEHKENPSEIIVKQIQNKLIKEKLVIETSVSAVKQAFDEYIGPSLSKQHDLIVVHMGLDAGADDIRLELGAVNLADFPCPDERGLKLQNEVIDPSLEKGEYITSSLEIKDLGIGELSDYGGTFISNYIYFICLRFYTTRALYIHLPPFSRMSCNKQLDAVNDIINKLSKLIR